MGSWRAVVAMAGAMLATPLVLVAQSDRARLSDLIERLELTPAGARNWLERLGASIGARHQIERLLLVTSDGETLLAVTGRERHIPEQPDMSRLLSQKGADIVLIHNHPSGLGLSATDLMHLYMPGTKAIAAIGHDGSVYVATAGPRYGGGQFGRQYEVACAEVDRRLNLYVAGTSDAPWKSAIPNVFAHLVASALERASVIEYRAFLAPALQNTFTTMAGPAGRAVARAAEVLFQPVAPGQDRRLPAPCRSDTSALSQLLANAQSRVTV